MEPEVNLLSAPVDSVPPGAQSPAIDDVTTAAPVVVALAGSLIPSLLGPEWSSGKLFLDGVES